MENHQLMSVDLMEIVIFLKAASLESFSKAATELNITTSMVSKHMASLENALGFRLFERIRSRVALTPAGRSLATDWKSLYSSFLFSIEKASKEAGTSNELICIGIGSSSNSERYLVPMFNAYDSESDGTRFRVELRRNFGLVDDLLRGTFDIIFLPYFMLEKIKVYSQLDSFVTLKHPLVIGMAADHPLSHKAQITISDLKKCRIMLVKRPVMEEYENMLNRICIAAGFKPRIDSQYMDDVDSAYLNIGGDRVFITDRLYRQIQTNAAVYRDIDGTESGLLAVWRKESPRRVLDFVRFAHDFFDECG